MAKKANPKSPPADEAPIKQEETVEETRKRVYVNQNDVPSCGLDEALRVPVAIRDNYAMAPTAPLRVAKALGLQPHARPFRMMCGAALAYGLVNGGAQADQIGLEGLAKRILRPTEEGDDLTAKREAFLRPRVYSEFLRKYDGNPVPRDVIAQNVLVDMGVPSERTAEVLKNLLEGAESLGLVTEIKGKKYVDLTQPTSPRSDDPLEDYRDEEPNNATVSLVKPTSTVGDALFDVDFERRRRVFITHGKNKQFVEPIKKLLRFGELEAVLAVEHETVSVPVPEKVLADMRSCGAAIIHVDAELKLMDDKANEHLVLNPNVLIEIGAALALYGRRFILLVRKGLSLPSNLQGLYEVRYSGDVLDGEATIKLLEAINDIKNHSLP